MSIANWLSVMVFAVLACIVLFYKTTRSGRKHPEKMQALVMISAGLLNLLALGDIASDPWRRGMQVVLAISGLSVLIYGLYLYFCRPSTQSTQSTQSPDSDRGQ